MRYRELTIQTQREAPNNARTQGAAWLVRAGYLSRQGETLPLGALSLERIRPLRVEALPLPLLTAAQETFFLSAGGSLELLTCPSCGYAARAELARFRKTALPPEAPLPVEKVPTPHCSTIESLASFLNIPPEKTAKALMYTRPADGRFVFAALRGEMTLSEAKLRREVGEVRLATAEEIQRAGAAPGYASPLGLKGALILVDDLLPLSSNLAAGANEDGFHFLNTNCGRDYAAEIVTDLALAGDGAPCAVCGASLALQRADLLAAGGEMDARAVLLALAETHCDDHGLCLPPAAAPLDVYLMNVPGRELDTLSAAQRLHDELEAAGLRVLLDDRQERAGVKFNDADLIGLPLRLTVGERALREGRVEIKERRGQEVRLVALEAVTGAVSALLPRH